MKYTARRSRNPRQNPSTQRKGVSRGKMRKVKKLTTEARRHGEKSCLIYKLQKIAASGVRNSADCAGASTASAAKTSFQPGLLWFQRWCRPQTKICEPRKSASQRRSLLRLSTHWLAPFGIHLSRNCCKAPMLFCHSNAAREVVSGNGFARGDGLW